MQDLAIGIFDSGIGGTSIWREIALALPNENTIYLADSKYAPYGSRPKDEIIALSIKNTEKLLELNCKVIVVACNTATTNAIKILREKYKVPFIGIEPAIKPAALNSKTKKIGVLATKGTLSSDLFTKTSDLYTNNIEITEVVGTGLVELIETGDLNSVKMIELLKKFTIPLVKKNIDYLVLGCSHYPYLIPALQKILPTNIHIIDSGEAVARQTKAILKKHNLINPSTIKAKHTFYSNTSLEVLTKILLNTSIQFEIEKSNF